jgi:transcription antitermination protein NusB
VTRVAGRHEARRVALDILFQADLTGRDPRQVLDEWDRAEEDVPAFARELVDGVAGDLPALDETIGRSAEGWSVPRMGGVDRSILRLAAHELRSRPDIPPAVAIDEAVEAAKELCSAEAPKFVNGILGAVQRQEAANR